MCGTTMDPLTAPVTILKFEPSPGRRSAPRLSNRSMESARKLKDVLIAGLEKMHLTRTPAAALPRLDERLFYRSREGTAMFAVLLSPAAYSHGVFEYALVDPTQNQFFVEVVEGSGHATMMGPAALPDNCRFEGTFGDSQVRALQSAANLFSLL